MTSETGPTPTQYFTHVNGTDYGPYTVEQLREFAGSGNITAESYIRADGGEWVLASAMPELEGVFPSSQAQPAYAGGQSYGAGQSYGGQSYAGGQSYGGGSADGISDKTYTVALLLSWLVGTFGIDRFYLGYTGLGIAKLLTCGGCGIWAIVDVVLLMLGKIPDAQGRPLRLSPEQSRGAVQH